MSRLSPREIGLLSLVVCVSVGIGIAIGFLSAGPQIPSCPNAYEVLVGSGDWDADAGRWSEYDCVDEVDLQDCDSRILPPGGTEP